MISPIGLPNKSLLITKGELFIIYPTVPAKDKHAHLFNIKKNGDPILSDFACVDCEIYRDTLIYYPSYWV